jgi:hypothetical protein
LDANGKGKALPKPQVTGLLLMHTNIWRLNSDSEVTRSCVIDENNMIGPGDIAWSMHVCHYLMMMRRMRMVLMKLKIQQELQMLPREK